MTRSRSCSPSPPPVPRSVRGSSRRHGVRSRSCTHGRDRPRTVSLRRSGTPSSPVTTAVRSRSWSARRRSGGVGYRRSTHPRPLLRSLPFHCAPATIRWAPQDEFLLGWVGRTLARGEQELHLDDADLDALRATSDEQPPPPRALGGRPRPADDDGDQGPEDRSRSTHDAPGGLRSELDGGDRHEHAAEAQPHRRGQLEPRVRSHQHARVASPWRPRKPAPVMKAREIKNSRASCRRRAATVTRYPNVTVMAAAATTSQKCAGWFSQCTSSAGRSRGTASRTSGAATMTSAPPMARAPGHSWSSSPSPLGISANFLTSQAPVTTLAADPRRADRSGPRAASPP
jgi:hypothetical protein